MSQARTRNEADTRAELIDPPLIAAGWSHVANSFIRREVNITQGRIVTGGKRGTPVISDYVLEYKGYKLAAVEAKKESLSYTEGVRQAKDYAQRLQCRIGYSTNGHEIYQIDLVSGEEALVERFLSPDELWQLTFSEEEPDFTRIWRERFSEIPFETKGDWQPRYYQENAVNAALESIANGNNRILLTLATGTGKTAISFQIAWKIFQTRWRLSSWHSPDHEKRRPRILFLADRNILANQAYNDFSAFEEDALYRIASDELRRKNQNLEDDEKMNVGVAGDIRKATTRSVPKNAAVFFTIFQTFMQGEDKEGNDLPYFGDYPTDFFDLIIVDECHRGGANDESAWRDILDYFSPAVQLGLTATPKRTDNADTYAYFGEPVYSYTLKEGINDGFLTPFKIYPIVGTMDEYLYTQGDGVVVEGEPESGKLYVESDFNRVITIPEREKKRVEYWMDLFNPQEKTIVFCATQEHAGLVRDMINQHAQAKGWTANANYCVRVTANDGAAGDNDLKIFQDNEKTIPTVLTTSRKLSTGVDARNVRNIVLMRPCNNMIEFKQIIGRGTRMYEGKDYFTIYDFVKAHHNFADPEWDGDPIDIEPSPETGGTTTGPREPSDPPPNTGPETGGKRPEKIKIKLSDGKSREIKHISSAMYWSQEGKPITAREFVERMFDDLPKFFGNEDELREIWSDPTTREKLLEDLSEAGYDGEKLDSMKELIDARDSDVYDVLAYVAYSHEAKTRVERSMLAKPQIRQEYDSYKQKEFIDFVLEKYVEDGVRELALAKISDLLTLKYNTISDAASELGSPGEIREVFSGFQRHLYEN